MPQKKISPTTLAIGSGKGGVGKSTVTVNLAIALAQKGWKVGLLDADLYGPSIPLMLGLRELSPQTTYDRDGKEKILPFTKFGVQLLSIGFFVEEVRSVTWRGPLLHGTLQKMILEVEWGDLDFFLIDLPPGTGDVPVSLSQLLKIDSALIVTTPQELAIVDAVKAINCFDLLEIPILGVIENMSGFTSPKDGCFYPIFGEGKAEELAQRFQIPLLGSIPLLPSIREGGDSGYPSAFNKDSPEGSCFHSIAKQVEETIELAKK